MQDDDPMLYHCTEEGPPDAFLTFCLYLEKPLPHTARKRHPQVGSQCVHALGDPGIVGANAHGPGVDHFLDFIAVVEDFPVHSAMLAYLRRYVQMGTTDRYSVRRGGIGIHGRLRACVL